MAIINSNLQPFADLTKTSVTPTTTTPAIGTMPLDTGSVSSQLDNILGNTSKTAAATPATPTTPATTTPVAQTMEVTPNMTVAGQVKGLIDSNSPLMQQAQAKSAEAANARGLINSSMGVQAGQAALYDAALPIATQDASTYATAGQFNAQQQNAMTVAGLNNDNQIQLANLQGKIQKELGGNKTASDLYTATMQQINNIQQSTGMDATTKQRNIDQAIAMLDAGLGMAGGIAGMDIGSLLDFSSNDQIQSTPAQAAWDTKAEQIKKQFGEGTGEGIIGSLAKKLIDQLGPRPT